MHIFPSADMAMLWVSTYGYIVLFPIMVLEGPIITVIGGFLSSVGIFNVYIVFLIVVLGDLTGDTIFYSIGRFGRLSVIDRWGHLFGMDRKSVEALEKHFHNHAGKTLLIGKLTHAVVSVVLIAAGAAKVPYKKYLWYNLLATLPKSLIFLLIGFYFGASLVRINHILDLTTVILFILFVASFLGYLFLRKYASKIVSKLTRS